MKLKISNNEKNIELDGVIRKIKSKFFVEIEVPDNIKLDLIIKNIQGYYNSIGNVTLLNNKNIVVKSSKYNSSITIYEYEVGYVIEGHIDEDTILFNTMTIYFKELDYFFVEDTYKINLEKMSEEFTITQKYKSEDLLSNEKISIKYNRTAGISHDEAGHILFLNPAKILLKFNEPMKLPQLFEEITKIEACFGFIIGRKMNLIEVNLCDSAGVHHELVLRFQKDYNEILLNEIHVVDLNSKQLLKDVLTQYYSNSRIAASINMFYEYIYNDLDDILEFTSLVNTLELILTDKKYNDDIKKYTLENNEELKENNEKMRKIFECISKEQCKFITSFYRFENVELRDKIKFIFYNKFKLQQNEKSEEYISKIIKTRNYYVHGGEKNKILNGVNMVSTKFLLRNMLYILIVEICSNESNITVDSYRMMIPIIYNEIIKNIDKEKEK